MSKLIFFDIDGTLVDFSMHIPDSTLEGLRLARANGHKIAICTGRPYTNIYPFLLDFGFDGVVASAGAYIQYQDQKIYHSVLETKKLVILAELFRRHGAAYFLQGYSGRFVSEPDSLVMDEVLSDGDSAKKLREGMILCEAPEQMEDMECGVYFRSDAVIEQMQEEADAAAEGYFCLTGCSFGTDIVYSGEITKKGVNKATGMQRLLEAMGMTQKDSVAFGDGSNDFEMIEFANQGIVMGNGIPKLKECGDYVTTAIDRDGIWNGLKHLKLI